MTDAPRKTVALNMVRLGVALLLGVHGYWRAFTDNVDPFGGFLEAKGLPAGIAIAWAVTIFEMVGSVLLALGRYVRVVAAGFITILTMGIVLVHGPVGWFVVGGGRNGVEYSVLLVICLLALMAGSPRRHV
jgi:putative oxidoreductase